MPTPSEAEDHLRVIRSLMERSTIYRAISAPVALVGGLSSLLACTLITVKPIEPRTANSFFLSCWLVVLVITALSNTFFLWRDATRRGDVFLSSGMRAALWALGPSFLIEHWRYENLPSFFLAASFQSSHPPHKSYVYRVSLALLLEGTITK